jgi:hypothetical protein
MANGGYVDMAAIAAVARELGTDFDVPDLAYIGAHPPLSTVFPVTCVAPMQAWLQGLGFRV